MVSTISKGFITSDGNAKTENNAATSMALSQASKKTYPTSPFTLFFREQMIRLPTEATSSTDVREGDDDEPHAVSSTQSPQWTPRPLKRRKTTQFAIQVPKVCELWKTLTPKEKKKWVDLAEISTKGSLVKNASPRSTVNGYVTLTKIIGSDPAEHH